ncbi:hypothetical protein VTK56DRAFT_839 [Thermocarpiscus australiensis]
MMLRSAIRTFRERMAVMQYGKPDRFSAAGGVCSKPVTSPWQLGRIYSALARTVGEHAVWNGTKHASAAIEYFVPL